MILALDYQYYEGLDAKKEKWEKIRARMKGTLTNAPNKMDDV